MPDALQTPAVLDAIREAATEANIPLEQLRVGNALNSINPETGQPEFFDLSEYMPWRRGPYDMRDHGAQMEGSEEWVQKFLKDKPSLYMPTPEDLARLPDVQKEHYAKFYEGTGNVEDVLGNAVPGVGSLYGKVGRWISRGLGNAADQDAATRAEIAKAYRSGISGRKPGA